MSRVVSLDWEANRGGGLQAERAPRPGRPLLPSVTDAAGRRHLVLSFGPLRQHEAPRLRWWRSFYGVACSCGWVIRAAPAESAADSMWLHLDRAGGLL